MLIGYSDYPPGVLQDLGFKKHGLLTNLFSILFIYLFIYYILFILCISFFVSVGVGASL